MIRATTVTLQGAGWRAVLEGDFELTRCGLWGSTVMSGLTLSAIVVSCAHANENGEAMRFVPQPELVQKIDPARTVVSTVPSTVTPTVASPQKVDGAAAGGAVADSIDRKVAQSASRPAVPASWPITLSEARERKKVLASGKREAWSEAEIQEARQRCTKILKRIAAVAVEEAPIREGSCGDPAPIRLISIGRKPEVVISPPALINCEMAEAMYKWIQTDLQPLARQNLGGPIIKIVKMSDYSCRNAYGRARGRLSEHGRVNAIDIAGFMTAKGDTTMLLADWGTTQRDVRRQIAAEKAKVEVAERQRLSAEQRGQAVARAALRQGAYPDRDGNSTVSETASLPPTALGMTSGAPAGGVARGSVIDGIPRMTVSIPGGSDSSGAGTPLDTLPLRLGGPRRPSGTTKGIALATSVESGVGISDIGKQRFLRGAHDTACKIFGTVLGPEANNAHRNHLHLDMAHRERGVFCQ